MKRKANISLELQASKVTIRFDLGYDLDLEYGICYISTESGPKVRCTLPDSDRVTSDIGVPSTHLVYLEENNDLPPMLTANLVVSIGNIHPG